MDGDVIQLANTGGVAVWSGNPLFRNCRFTGNSNGIWLEPEGSAEIESCVFLDNGKGIVGPNATVSGRPHRRL